MSISPEALHRIRQQLGREPRGIVRIAVERSGIPLVLQMRSLVDDKPFPTLYWLSSKSLYKAIAQIETDGYVKALEQQLQQDEALRQRLLADQQAYVDQRWQLMDPDDRQRIDQRGFTELFHRYGIGGITQWDKVRCLHMHYAHHLVAGNVIGGLMDQVFQLDALAITD